MAWQLQTAKQHFSELVERARTEGPQVVTKHGRDAVVVVSAEEYTRLRDTEPSLIYAYSRSIAPLTTDAMLSCELPAGHQRDL
jgi:prevent-host-death family protein